MSKKIVAIPPNDYKGTIANWIGGLISRGLMKETQFYGDIEISEEEYTDLLQECEEE